MLSLACANRQLPSEGTTYEVFATRLEKWHEDFRLNEVFEDDENGYEPPESLDLGRFEELLSEYHAEGEDAPKLEEFTDRAEAEKYLIQAQTATIEHTLLELNAEESDEDSSN